MNLIAGSTSGCARAGAVLPPRKGTTAAGAARASRTGCRITVARHPDDVLDRLAADELVFVLMPRHTTIPEVPVRDSPSADTEGTNPGSTPVTAPVALPPSLAIAARDRRLCAGLRRGRRR